MSAESRNGRGKRAPPRKVKGRLDLSASAWSGRGDSNPRPLPWQGSALPLSYSRSQFGVALAGAEGQNRTDDTSIFSAVLYQLSYLGQRPASSNSTRRAFRLSSQNLGGVPASNFEVLPPAAVHIHADRRFSPRLAPKAVCPLASGMSSLGAEDSRWGRLRMKRVAESVPAPGRAGGQMARIRLIAP